MAELLADEGDLLLADLAEVGTWEATIELACAGPGACDEHLVLTISRRVLAGRAHVVIVGGERQTVHMRLTRRARVLLTHRSRLRGALAGPGGTRAVTLVRNR